MIDYNRKPEKNEIWNCILRVKNKYDVKRDADESQSHLCNSLNAELGNLDHILASPMYKYTDGVSIEKKNLRRLIDYMRRAQNVITYLQEENEKLMKQNDSGSIKDGKAEWREMTEEEQDEFIGKNHKLPPLDYSKFITESMEEALDDPVNHPAHYTSGSIECIDFIDSCGYGLDFCLANAIKYLTRCKLKGTCEQDIRKAIWYATHAADKIKEGKYSIE